MEVAAAIDGDVRAGAGERSALVRERACDRAFEGVASDDDRRAGPRQPLVMAGEELDIAVQGAVDNVEVLEIVADAQFPACKVVTSATRPQNP
jgi:hypothetical protein